MTGWSRWCDIKRPIKSPLDPLTVGVGLTMVNILQREIGNGERGANNSGEFVEKYAAAVDRRAPILWCSALVYWAYLEACTELDAGVLVGHKRSISAKGLRREIHSAGGYDVDFNRARPGDVAIWHRGVRNTWRGHAGLVLAKQAHENTFHCIEGNKGVYPSNVGVFKHALGEPMFMTFVRFPLHEVASDD